MIERGKMHIFSPIDLIFTKFKKKFNFSPAASITSLGKISFGEKVLIKKGGGAKYEFQI